MEIIAVSAGVAGAAETMRTAWPWAPIAAFWWKAMSRWSLAVAKTLKAVVEKEGMAWLSSASRRSTMT